MKDTTTVNSFKDLKDALAEVRKNNPPAETRYEKQAKHMGYTKDKTIVVEGKSKKKKYDEPLKGFPGNEDVNEDEIGRAKEVISLQKKHDREKDLEKDKLEKEKEQAKASADRAKQSESSEVEEGSFWGQDKMASAIDKKQAKTHVRLTRNKGGYERATVPKKDKKKIAQLKKDGYKIDTTFGESLEEASALAGMQDIVKTKGAKKIGGVMVDMFTASVITQAYDKVNDANKKKMENSNVQTLVKLAQKVMGMKESVEEARKSKNYYEIGGDRYDGGVVFNVYVNGKKVHDQILDGGEDFKFKGKKYPHIDKVMDAIAKSYKLKAKDFQRVETEESVNEDFVTSMHKTLKGMGMMESFVTKSPFKLKSKQYPRALAIETLGYGKRHASVDELIEACDSFGMITEEELQIQQIEKTLGKQGYLTYNKAELADIFEDRETQRIILALDSVTSDAGLTEYDRATINKALEEELHVEFVKPDGMKAIGPVLKMSSNTYNLKDMHTGKSFTYKYIEEDNNMKTFGQVISEAKFPKKLVRQAGGIAFDKRYVAGNMTGAIDAIEKLKKGLSDDPDVRDMLRLANESFNNEFYKSMSEEDKTEYQKFFQKTLKQFGVQSPAELEGDKEKEFYNYIDKNWKGKGEKKESVEEGKFSKYSDLLIKKAKLVAQGPIASKEVAAVNILIAKEMIKLGVRETQVKVDGRARPFKEKMTKLGYFKR